jgi:sugar/nucleoside kinase (ribokinase family)
MAKYLSLGNVFYDSTISVDGEYYGEYLGGEGFHALAGIRLWTKDVGFVTRAGTDFSDGFSKWLDDNEVSDRHIKILLDYTPHTLMKFNEDGSFNVIPNKTGAPYNPTYQGILNSLPDDIEPAISENTLAFYHNTIAPDRRLFEQFAKIREKYGVKSMWELFYYPGSPSASFPYFTMEKLKNAVSVSGMWSLNRNEASDIFGIPRENEDDLINEIIRIGGEMCYFRCGDKGAYVVTGNSAAFCPSIDIPTTVDPIGCGNNSTGAAMYAWCETSDPLMTAVMAAISAGYNAAQKGPMMRITEQDTAHASNLAQTYYKKLVNRHPSVYHYSVEGPGNSPFTERIYHFRRR